jgi:hypothetical protein
LKLKSFGCSLIFGTDLPDNGQNQFYPKPSFLTWPALLAQHHGLDYACYARPGAGNLQIVNRLLNQLNDIEPAVYVVGWTWADRFDYTTANAPQPWKTITPVDTDPVAQTYYKHIQSNYCDKLRSLINIKTAIDTLLQSGNKFIMTYMDESIFDPSDTDPSLSYLQRYCRSYMTEFNQTNFLTWSHQQGFEVSSTAHPLEEAHRAGFELLNSYNLL